MDRRRWMWTKRARAADRYWDSGIPIESDDGALSPDVFRLAVVRAGRSVLVRMAEDETTLHSLRGGASVDAQQVVDDVITEFLPRMDPTGGLRLAIAKLQLAVLEALDRLYLEEDGDAEDHLDREWTDEQGLVDFL